MTARGLSILGTDTAVGKTTVSTGILRLARRAGLRLLPFKPVETGCATAPADTDRLAQAAGVSGFSPGDAGLYRFPDPLAPSVAARLADVSIDLARIVDRASHLLQAADALLFESAGGVLTPYGPALTSASLAATFSEHFAMDTLLVAADRLGTINQTALAVEHLKRTSCRLLGIVLVRVTSTTTPDQPFNAAEIGQLTGVPILGTIRHCPSLDPDLLADALASDVNLQPVLAGRLAPR